MLIKVDIMDNDVNPPIKLRDKKRDTQRPTTLMEHDNRNKNYGTSRRKNSGDIPKINITANVTPEANKAYLNSNNQETSKAENNSLTGILAPFMRSFRISDKSPEITHVKSDTSIVDSEAGDEQILNEMTMDVVDLENGLRGKDFSDTFMEFLKTELSDENLEFYIEVQNFKKIVMPAEIHSESKRIFDLYIDDNCEKQINIDSNARQAVNKLMSYPNSNMFDACEEQILNLMKSDCYPRFLQSELYKKSSRNLPSFSRRNKLLVPLIKDGKIMSNVSNDLKVNKSTSNISIPSIDMKDRASLSARDKYKMIVMPLLEESILDVKTAVKPNSIRIIFHKRNYILSPKDGQTFRELLAFLNISNKELASYYGFLLPCQKIIELSQNPVYFLKNTIDLRKFSLINFLLRDQTYSLKCPYEYDAVVAVNSFLSVVNLKPNQVESVKLKNKKPYTPDAISGKYDRTSLIITLVS